MYEHAAGLLAAAEGLKAAAQASGATAALGPTLACLEASLDALVLAAERLGGHAAEHASEASRDDPRAGGPEVAHRFRGLVDALAQCRAECTHARVAIGPVHGCAGLTS